MENTYHKCNKCGLLFDETQGTWPKYDLNGDPVYVQYVDGPDDELLGGGDIFYCYDCVD